MASNSNSGQKFISRNRKPRVHISYEDPYDAEKLVELPFVMGVLADLSGNASAVSKVDMIDRNFLDIDMDNFDKRMSAIEPGIILFSIIERIKFAVSIRKCVTNPPLKSAGGFSYKKLNSIRSSFTGYQFFFVVIIYY